MDQKAIKSSSFFSRFFITQLHKKASKKIEDFGKEKLLTPEVNKLATNIEVDITAFPEKITFLPPNNNTKYASEFSSKFYKLQERMLLKVVLPIFLVSYLFSCLLILNVFSFLVKFINNPYLSDLVVPVLMAFIISYPPMLIIFSLMAPFKKGIQALADERRRLETKEWMEQIVEQYENEFLNKPDERFEKLKSLSVQKKLELENLIKELTQTEEQRKKYKNVLQEYSELIDKIILRNQELERMKEESLQELLRPKPFFRDLLVNLSSNIVWIAIVAIVSFVLGVLYK